MGLDISGFVYDTGSASDPNSGSYDPTYGSDVLVLGDSNTPPVYSDTPQTSIGSVFGGLHNILGAIGTTARDVGSAVGSVRRSVREAKGQYSTAEKNAESSNKVGQWWQYSSTTDKLMIGIGVLGLVLVLKGK